MTHSMVLMLLLILTGEYEFTSNLLDQVRLSNLKPSAKLLQSISNYSSRL